MNLAPDTYVRPTPIPPGFTKGIMVGELLVAVDIEFDPTSPQNPAGGIWAWTVIAGDRTGGVVAEWESPSNYPTQEAALVAGAIFADRLMREEI